jgi:membrane dipeptidase
MEPKKRWDGYTSWSFLEPDVDYRPFDLEPQIGRVPPFVYPLDSDQHDRADRLLSDCVCISLHDHCGITPRDMAENDAYVRQGREWYGYEGLAASGLDAVFENFMDGTATITSKTGWWTDVIHDPRDAPRRRGAPVGRVRRLDREGHPRCPSDRRIAIIPCIEGAAPIENELDRLDVLYGLGVRMIGVTYSESNQLGGEIKDPDDGGLTRFGRDAVRRMNRLGLAIDLSHTGDRTAMQTCERSEKPVFLSHSGARACTAR